MDTSLEEGEISSDGECYVPLKRPDQYSTFSNPIINPQLLNDDSDILDNTSEDSESDSDCGTKQKRPKLKPRSKRVLTKPVNHKYNIWSTRIQEDVLVDTLNTCDVTKKDRSRDVESYDFPVREDYGDKISDTDLRDLLINKNNKKDKKHKKSKGKKKMENNEDGRKNNKRTRDDRKNKDLRLVGKKHKEDDGRGAPRYLIDLSVTVESTEEDIAKDLANKLYETKEDLLLKIVATIGKERAIKIFNDVKRIEKEGGMLIMNQSRRRTPGGIYLFLIKHDGLTQEEHNKIFEEDKQKTKNEVREKKKSAASKFQQRNALGKNIPELLKSGELCIEKINEKRWTNEKRDIEHAEVENPPPTPETDSAENIEDRSDHQQDKILVDQVSGRQTQEYDEEFLDLGNVNDMDLF